MLRLKALVPVDAEPDAGWRTVAERRAGSLTDPRLPLALVTELGGADLRQTISTRGRMGPELLRGLAYQLLSGIAYMHASNVVHRDLVGTHQRGFAQPSAHASPPQKPGNILLNDNGRLVVSSRELVLRAAPSRTECATRFAQIADMGLARLDNAASARDASSELRNVSVVGSPGYLSPEVRGCGLTEHSACAPALTSAAPSWC